MDVGGDLKQIVFIAINFIKKKLILLI